MDASIEKIKKLHRDGKLCLFVGAGISKSCGLPDWNVLSAMVIKETWPDTGPFDVLSKHERSARSSYSPRDAMRLAKRKLGQQFNSVVYKCLYLEATALSSSLEAIVSLQNVRRIICSNYDDLLEESYTKRGIGFRSLVQGDVLPSDTDEVLIFHPHGFLPRGNYSRNYLNDAIILSEDDYHELYASPYSWSNVIQLNLLSSFNVLFVGCSLTDPNLRRLLDISNKVRVPEHFTIMRNPDFELHDGKHQPDRPRWWRETLSFQKHVEEENLRERGITPIWYQDHSDLSNTLNQIG
jgi:hypothetical protein